MKHRFLLFVSALVISFISVQKINAQGKKLLNRNILVEIKNIQKRFSDSINRYDYKKDKVLYSQKYKRFYGEKLKGFEDLYHSISDKEVIIGKIDPNISFRATKEIQVENNVLQSEVNPPLVLKNKSIDIAEVENYQQLVELKKQMTVNFPAYLMEDFGEGVYRCKLNFIIDVDGKFKKVKYSESSNMEFSIISVLFLYAIGGLDNPLMYNKKPIIQSFAQPIVLNFK
ncbi:hypothetical protein [Chryseobacterium oncorhynchi]|uniref:TonB C-terminal domain-containing protein n=1 Tax=Chryseobacterium oncorhynchi TaxID=741074 RepID=A0A316WX54_9FLAO|nr:hypothetical protein [Chryseobacterium oncorhynchi]PWN63220.1 hypothetical protein C1638_014185 [Chryseobacterium oncorhynchi]